MLSKVFVFGSGIITGVITGIVLVGASMTMRPETWKKVIAANILLDEE